MSNDNAKSELIDIGRKQIGAIYAKAFLGAVGDEAALDHLQQFQSLVEDVLDPFPGLAAMFASPRVSTEEMIGMIDRIFGSRSTPTMLNFLKVVCENGRLDCLREIYRATRQLYNEARGIAEVHLTTAQPIDSLLTQRISDALTSHLGSEVDLVVRSDPGLIGGMVVRVGDKVYDASVAQQLTSMRRQAVERTVQEMKQAADRFVTAAG